MTKNKIRFVFTLDEDSWDMKLAQYLKKSSDRSKELVLNAVRAYYLPLVLEEESASAKEILDAVDDCRYSLDTRSEYLLRRFSRQQPISTAPPSPPNDPREINPGKIGQPSNSTQLRCSTATHDRGCSTFDEESLF